MVFQHEVLYALLGFTGKVILDREGKLSLAPGLPLLDASERELVERLLRLGESYSFLESFCTKRLLPTSQPGWVRSDAYEVAFALGIEQCMQPYRARVLALEQQLICTPDLSLPALQLGFGEFELMLPELHRIVIVAEREQLRRTALLDLLEAVAVSSGRAVRDSVRVLLSHTRRVFLNQLSAWLLHGELISEEEFFVSRNQAALEQISMPKSLEFIIPWLYHSVEWSVRKYLTFQRSSESEEAQASNDLPMERTCYQVEASWAPFEIAPELKPAVLPMRLAERILFIGKVVRVLRGNEKSFLVEPAEDDERASTETDKLYDGTSFVEALNQRDERWRTSRLDTPRYRAAVARRAEGVRTHVSFSHLELGEMPQTPSSSSTDHSPRAASVPAGKTTVSSSNDKLPSSVQASQRSFTDASAALASAEMALDEIRAQAEDVRVAEERAAVAEAEAEVEANSAFSDIFERPPLTDKRSGGLIFEELNSFGMEIAELHLAEGGTFEIEPLERLLARMHRAASERLCQQLLDSGLLKLLENVKAFFFLGRGELFHSLIQATRFYMDAMPPAHLDLQQLLRAAAPESMEGLLSSLSLSVEAPISATTPYAAWRCLKLDMTIDWPLQLLVTATHMQRYNELFSFLLVVKRVQMELHAAWNAQTQFGRLPASERAVLMPLWRLRAHMAFLVDNLQYYLQVDVLEVQWQAFTQVATACPDFEKLNAEHEKCIEAMQTQCFLHAGSVSAALHEIFQLCLSLCRMLSYADCDSQAEVTYHEQFATISREFSRQSAFLFSFLSNISSPQASPHLGQLLLRLDFNRFLVGQASIS